MRLKRTTLIEERSRGVSAMKLNVGKIFTAAAVTSAMFVLPMSAAHAVPACGTSNVNCSGSLPADHPVPTFGLACTSCHAPATTPPTTTPPTTTPPTTTPPPTTPPTTTPPTTTPPTTTPPTTTPPTTTPPTTTPPTTTPPVTPPPTGTPGYMDPAKMERRVQKWESWWDKKQDRPNAMKHYETYRKQMERLGQTPAPYAPGAMPGATGPGRDDDDDDRRERHRGKRKD